MWFVTVFIVISTVFLATARLAQAGDCSSRAGRRTRNRSRRETSNDP